MPDDQSGKGPWGAPPPEKKPDSGKGKAQSPWGQNDPAPKGQKRPEPDMDEMLRQAQARIRGLFGGNGGRGDVPPGGSGRGGQTGKPGGGFGELPVAVILVVLLVIYGLSGFYRVLPEEEAVIKTFGKWTSTRALPGLSYHVPWPVQSVEKVNVTFERRIEIGFRGDLAPNRTSSESRNQRADIPGESLMLTGDENIIDIDFVVLWRISDAGHYLFNIRDPETTIKRVAESAMREIIGRTRIQQALTEARAQIEQDTSALMQQMLDTYESGVVINDVQLQQVDPPIPVVDAFDDVQRARADMERLRNEADAYRNNILPRARGEAARILQQAEAYREEIINRATGDAARFTSVYGAYSQSRDITARRLYIETIEEILGRTNKIIIETEGNGNVLPYLPLNELRMGQPARNSATSGAAGANAAAASTAPAAPSTAPAANRR